MRVLVLLLSLTIAFDSFAQANFLKNFKQCNVSGSTSIYDYKNKRWLFTDSIDATIATLPASTFKIINLLIALETGIIKDENQIVKWTGYTDTLLYGYRPEIYKDMSVKKAFQVSAGWVFIELAKKIGKEKYRDYLTRSGYGNSNLSNKEIDFWNFGAFGISPHNQIQFLIKVYEGKLPFSKRNLEILKRVMKTEEGLNYVIRSKTGWTKSEDRDWGWWVGWVEQKQNTYFFATRIVKTRSDKNFRFSECRKEITKNILKSLKML